MASPSSPFEPRKPEHDAFIIVGPANVAIKVFPDFRDTIWKDAAGGRRVRAGTSRGQGARGRGRRAECRGWGIAAGAARREVVGGDWWA